MSIISIIFAMNANRIIGNNGDLPWHLPSDLQRFRTITTGSPVIMGRKTFESILARNGKPLPDRRNVVITRNKAAWRSIRNGKPTLFRNCLFVSSLLDAIVLMQDAPEVFVIGGAEIYAQALPFADRMYFTQVGGTFNGDVKFPLFNVRDWDIQHDELVLTDNHPYAFSILHRAANKEDVPNRPTGDNLVNPAFADDRGYHSTLADIIAAGICPFCPKTFLWHPWPILHRLNDWFITRSGWPYANAEHHFLIIGNRHITATTDLTARDYSQIHEIVSWACNKFNLSGYGLLSRSGDMHRTGSSVQHLHFHLIQPKLGSHEKALPVWFALG